MTKDLLPSLKTRVSLLERLRDWKDQVSWQEFFDTYWKLIHSAARRQGLADMEAQDVVQETMFCVARHMPGFKYDPSIGTFKGWLLTVTRCRIYDQLRKRGPVLPRNGHDSSGLNARGPLHDLPDPANLVPDDVWEADWKKALIEAAWVRIRKRVKPAKLQLFDFYVNKNWPPKKVAERFGTTVAEVYMTRHRVIKLLQQEVKRLEKKPF